MKTRGIGIFIFEEKEDEPKPNILNPEPIDIVLVEGGIGGVNEEDRILGGEAEVIHSPLSQQVRKYSVERPSREGDTGRIPADRRGRQG